MGWGRGSQKGWGPIPGILHVTDADTDTDTDTDADTDTDIDTDTDTDKPDTIGLFFQKRLKKLFGKRFSSVRIVESPHAVELIIIFLLFSSL